MMLCVWCDKNISEDEVYRLYKCKHCGYFYEKDRLDRCPNCGAADAVEYGEFCPYCENMLLEA